MRTYRQAESRYRHNILVTDVKEVNCSQTIEDTEEQHGLCPKCDAVDTFKHCYWSEACQVEYDHSYTDLPRLLDNEDIVLVTPVNDRCRVCIQYQYREHPDDSSEIGRQCLLNTRDCLEEISRRWHLNSLV
jgi:hypothetical protein